MMDHLNYLDCYEIFERSEFCPCCMKLYDVEDEESNMVCCDTCDRYDNQTLLKKTVMFRLQYLLVFS